MRDTLIETLTTIRHNKLRTALTGFAVAWGIFILIVLLGAGNGLIHGITGNANQFLANSMMVGGGSTSKAYDGMSKGRPVTLNDRDMDITRQSYAAHVDDVGAELSKGGLTVTCEGQYTKNVNAVGVFPNEQTINKRQMLCGRFIDPADLEDRRKVIVLSSNTAKELFPDAPLSLHGRIASIGGTAYRVIGIYKSNDNDMGNEAYMPFTTFRTIYHKGDEAGEIIFSFHGLKSEADNEAFEQRYRASLNTNHRAAPDDENAVWIWNRFTMNMQMDNGMSILRTALWIIGLLTLLSGIVGVSNIMLITVKERTREFGIRKAIGAKPWSILRLIITESILITTFFGYIGMVLGIAANQYMDATMGHASFDTGLFSAQMFVDPTVGLGTCVRATVVMIVAGTLAGLIPARRAARIRPIEALRAE